MANDKMLDALNWQPQRKVSQAAFDEAVQDSIEALGMTAEEAVTSAVEEFTMQGVDMSDIVMTEAGGDTKGHPARTAIDRVVEATRSAGPAEAVQSAALEACNVFSHSDADPSAWQQALAVAYQSDALRDVLNATVAWQAEAASSVPLLCLCASLLQSVSIRDSFGTEYLWEGETRSGADVVCTMLSRHAADAVVIERVGEVCTSAAAGSEDSKVALMASDFPVLALRVLADERVALPAAAALLTALRALMTDDDRRPPASKAFMHARALALDHGAVPVYLAVLRRAHEDEAVLHSVVSSLQQLCANDEICKQVRDQGGVQLVMHTVTRHSGHASLVASTCSLLRQLAKSDDVKRVLVESEGLDLLQAVFVTHKESAAACAQALGVLATLLLRHPDHCEVVFAKAGLMYEVDDVMRRHCGSAPVMRQACQVVRNLVVRNPDLKAPALAMGLEARMRSAKKLKDCDDVASAALRDLGLEHYK